MSESEFNYYEAPPQHIFEDIKKNAAVIWGEYEDPYRSEKFDRIADLLNIKDNAWFLVSMFDHINQEKLLRLVEPETAALIRQARGY